MLCSLPFVSHFDIHLSRTQIWMPSYFPSIAQSVSVGNVLIISSSVFFVVNFSCASRVGDMHAQHRDVQTLIDTNILLCKGFVVPLSSTFCIAIWLYPWSFKARDSGLVVVANLDNFLSFDGTTVLCTTACKPLDLVQLMLCSPLFVSHFEATFHVPRCNSLRALGGFAVFAIWSGWFLTAAAADCTLFW